MSIGELGFARTRNKVIRFPCLIIIIIIFFGIVVEIFFPPALISTSLDQKGVEFENFENSVTFGLDKLGMGKKTFT